VNEETFSHRSWQEIAASYDELALRHDQFEPMRALVHQLAESPNAAELERNTSMHTLLVSNAPARGWRENVLRVSFLPDSDEFEFEYLHYDGDTNTSKKRCSISESWDTLSTFLRYKFGTLLPNDRNA
jgi:hypothetical protein